MSRVYLEQVLSKYVPEGTVTLLADWIVEGSAKVKITRSRSTKLGDYRPPQRGQSHLITINHDLNPYSFLITLVHELAHLRTWQKHKNKVNPHGKEWKHEYKHLMRHFMDTAHLPQDINQALKRYMSDPAASSCSDIHLQKALKAYDNRPENILYLEEAPENCLFKLENGMIFRKGKKLRKRYTCINVITKREYYVSSLAEIELIQEGAG